MMITKGLVPVCMTAAVVAVLLPTHRIEAQSPKIEMVSPQTLQLEPGMRTGVTLEGTDLDAFASIEVLDASGNLVDVTATLSCRSPSICDLELLARGGVAGGTGHSVLGVMKNGKVLIPLTLEILVVQPTLAALLLNQTEVESGDVVEVGLSLERPAPRGGVDVTLRSSQPRLFPTPRTVTVRAGQTDLIVKVVTGEVTTDGRVDVTASYGRQVLTESFAVLAPPPPMIPDLRLASCWIDPPSPVESEVISVYAVVENIGAAEATLPEEAQLILAEFEGPSPGAFARRGFVSDGITIPPGESHELRAGYAFPNTVQPGDLSFRVTVDPDELLEEVDEFNNQMVCPSVTVAAVLRADLVITDVSIDPAEPSAGDYYKFVVTVVNQGEGVADKSAGGGTPTSLLIAVEGAWGYGRAFPQGFSIPPGESRTYDVEASWDGAQEAGTRTWTFTLDKDDNIFESDEDNNEATITVTVSGG